MTKQLEKIAEAIRFTPMARDMRKLVAYEICMNLGGLDKNSKFFQAATAETAMDKLEAAKLNLVVQDKIEAVNENLSDKDYACTNCY